MPMSASVVLLMVVLFLVLLALVGPRWAADTRAPGGWQTSGDPAPLWPTVPGEVSRRN